MQEQAAKANKNANGFKLDKSHVLATNLMADYNRIINTEQEYVEPPLEEFKEQENLKSWMLDEQARDQFVLRVADDTQVLWNNALEGPEMIKETKRWSDSYVRWSPKGTYLATFHHQGILLWGGPSWKKLRKFGVAGVVDILFSPGEKYMVTWSPQRGAIVWEVRTGKQLREFPDMVNADKFGKFKWSFDEKYIARIAKDKAGNHMISVFTTQSDPPMMLLDKKSVKAPDVEDMAWSPTANMLVYWQPETESGPARVILMDFPSRTVVAQKNLFNVNTCKIYWQESGDHLCVMVERLGKGKAPKKFYNFEVFRVTEKDVPTEVLKMDVPIVDFAWEPRGTRFIVIHGENARPDISVYSMSGEMMKQIGETLESKPANHIYWAPQGQFCVFAGLQSPALNGVLEFWDINAMELMGYQEHLMCTNVAWDPTGRYVATYVSVLRQTVREQVALLLVSICCFRSVARTLLSNFGCACFCRRRWRTGTTSTQAKVWSCTRSSWRNFSSSCGARAHPRRWMKTSSRTFARTYAKLARNLMPNSSRGGRRWTAKRRSAERRCVPSGSATPRDGRRCMPRKSKCERRPKDMTATMSMPALTLLSRWKSLRRSSAWRNPRPKLTARR